MKKEISNPFGLKEDLTKQKISSHPSLVNVPSFQTVVFASNTSETNFYCDRPSGINWDLAQSRSQKDDEEEEEEEKEEE